MMGMDVPLVVETSSDRPSSGANVGGSQVKSFLAAHGARLRLPFDACYGHSQTVRIAGPSDRTGYPSIDSYVKTVTAACMLPVVLGGDHRATLHILRAAFVNHGLGGLVVLDAHTDCQGLDQPLSNYNVLGLIRKEFPALRMILIGARDSDVHFVRQLGVFDDIIDAADFATIGLKGTLDIVNSLMTGRRCYLSIDLDVLDPLFFPCVAAPISGGLQPLHLFGLIKGLRPTLVAADIVEFVADQASPLHYLLVADLLGQLTAQS